MTAVRHGTCISPGIAFDHSIVRPPTDVMAITSLPKPRPIIQSPVFLWRFVFPNRQPLAAFNYLKTTSRWAYRRR